MIELFVKHSDGRTAVHEVKSGESYAIRGDEVNVTVKVSKQKPVFKKPPVKRR